MRRLIICFLALIISLSCVGETIEARSPTLTLNVDEYTLWGELYDDPNGVFLANVGLNSVSPQVINIVWDLIGNTDTVHVRARQQDIDITDYLVMEACSTLEDARLTVRANLYLRDGSIITTDTVHFFFGDYGQGGGTECYICYCYDTQSETAYAVVYYWTYDEVYTLNYYRIVNPFTYESIENSDTVITYTGEDTTYMLGYYTANIEYDEETGAYWIEQMEPEEEKYFDEFSSEDYESVLALFLDREGLDLENGDVLIHAEDLIATQNGYEVFDDDYHIYNYIF